MIGMDRLLDVTIKKFLTIIYFYTLKDKYYIKIYNPDKNPKIIGFTIFHSALRAYNNLKYKE